MNVDKYHNFNGGGAFAFEFGFQLGEHGKDELPSAYPRKGTIFADFRV
jgi:hypothetical protein